VNGYQQLVHVQQRLWRGTGRYANIKRTCSVPVTMI